MLEWGEGRKVFFCCPILLSLRHLVVIKAAANCKNMVEYTVGLLVGALALLPVCQWGPGPLWIAYNERGVLAAWVSMWNICDCLLWRLWASQIPPFYSKLFPTIPVLHKHLLPPILPLACSSIPNQGLWALPLHLICASLSNDVR